MIITIIACSTRGQKVEGEDSLAVFAKRREPHVLVYVMLSVIHLERKSVWLHFFPVFRDVNEKYTI